MPHDTYNLHYYLDVFSALCALVILKFVIDAKIGNSRIVNNLLINTRTERLVGNLLF